MNDRMCILSRASMPPEDLIRFVAAPDGSVVPDLRRRLPGRGAHIEARRESVEQAVRRGLLKRALRQDVQAGPELADLVDQTLVRSALGSLGLARKAGQLVTGAAKVDAAIRGGRALAVIHAADGAEDGVRKLHGAVKAAALTAGVTPVPVFQLFDLHEMGLALGGDNVVHAAVLSGDAGLACVKRLRALAKFRGESPGNSGSALHEGAAVGNGSNERAGHSSNPCGTDDRRGTRPAQEAEA